MESTKKIILKEDPNSYVRKSKLTDFHSIEPIYFLFLNLSNIVEIFVHYLFTLVSQDKEQMASGLVFAKEKKKLRNSLILKMSFILLHFIGNRNGRICRCKTVIVLNIDVII